MVKKVSIQAKLIVALFMSLFFIAGLGFRVSGGLTHEMIGLTFCALCLLHVIINWDWYRNILKGKYTPRRMLNTFLNLSLPVGLIALGLSGIMNSSHLFGFLKFKGSLEIRQFHSLMAYWGIVVLGVHAGLQWPKVLAALEHKIGSAHKWVYSKLVLRNLAALLSAYGLWASFDRAMGSKLFQGFSFDFWNPAWPEVFFFTHNIAIMALYISITHYALKMFAKAPPQKRNDKENTCTKNY